MEDENDVLPPMVREKAKSFVRLFGIPLAAIILVGTVAWSLTMSGDKLVVDMKDAETGATYIKGVVVKNTESDSPLSRYAFVEVLDKDDAIVRIFYSNQHGNCASKTANDAYDLAYGDKIEAYGKEAGPGVISVCEFPSHYIKPAGKADVTARWKEYLEPTVMMRFKYPPAWSIATSSYSGASVAKLFSSPQGAPDITLSAFVAKDFTVEEWIAKYYVPSTLGNQADLESSDVTVGGSSAVLVARADGSGGRAIFLKRGDRMIQIETRPQSGEAEASAPNQGLLADVVLSTVVFGSQFDAVISQSSGIRGTVKIGPSCPVVRDDDKGQCDDKPYAAAFVVFDPSGRVVTRFSSGKDGTFQVGLLPGEYTLSAESTAAYPAFNRMTVNIPPEKFLDVTLMFDTGIR